MSEQSNVSLFKQISDLSTSMIEKCESSTNCIQQAYLSEIEAAILRSTSPIKINETEVYFS